MPKTIGELILKLGLDTSGYYEDLEQMRLDTIAVGKEIERSFRGGGFGGGFGNTPPLSPKFDDRNLTALNKKFDDTKRNYNDLSRHFSNSPITPRTNTRPLDELSNKLREVRNQSRSLSDINITVRGANTVSRAQAQQNIKVELDTRQIDQSFKTLSRDLGESIGDEVAKGIKKGSAKNPIKAVSDVALSAPKTIVRGFYEGVGITYSEQLTKGFIKGIEGKFNTSLQRIAEKSSTQFLSAGERAGNNILKKMGIAEGLAAVKPAADKTRKALEEIIPAELLEQKLGKVEGAISRVLDNLLELKSVGDQLKGLEQLGGALGGVAQVPIAGVNQRRNRKLDFAAQLAQERAKEMIANGELQEIDPNAKKIAIVSGGFAGTRGKSSKSVAERVKLALGEGVAVDSIDNVETDTSANLSKAPKWASQILARFAKQNVIQGFNKDAIESAAKALAYKQMGVKAEPTFIGYSGGGYVAKESTEILGRLGVKSKGVGIGTPMFGLTGQVDPSQYRSYVGEGDPLSKLQKLFQSPNLRTLKDSGQAHKLSNYLGGADLQKELSSFLGVKTSGAQKAQFELHGFEEEMNSLAQDLGAVLSDSNQAQFFKKTGLFQAQIQQIKGHRAKLASLIEDAIGDVAEQIEEYDAALAEAEMLVKQVYGVQEEVSAPLQKTARSTVQTAATPPPAKVEPPKVEATKPPAVQAAEKQKAATAKATEEIKTKTAAAPQKAEQIVQQAAKEAIDTAKLFEEQYQRFIVETGKAFGIAQQSIRLPEIKELDISQAGGYAEKENQLILPKGKIKNFQEMLGKSLKEMATEEIDAAILQLSTIAHEGFHGMQFGFTGLSLVENARSGRINTPAINASEAESKTFERLKGNSIGNFAKSSVDHAKNRPSMAALSKRELIELEKYIEQYEKDAYSFQAKFMEAMIAEMKSGSATVGAAFEGAIGKLISGARAQMEQLKAEAKPQAQQVAEPISADEFNKQFKEVEAELNKYTVEILKEIARLSGRGSVKGKKADIVGDLMTNVRPAELDRARAAVEPMIERGSKGGQKLKKLPQTEQEKQAIATFKEREQLLYKELQKLDTMSGAARQKYLGELLDRLNENIANLDQINKQQVSAETRLTLGKTKGRFEGIYREYSPKLKAKSPSMQQKGGVADVDDISLARVANGQAQQIARQAQKTYESIVRSVAAASSKTLAAQDMPKLVVDNNRLQQLGAKALYDIKRNQIVIDAEIAKILEGGAKSLDEYTEQLKDVVHEARHAMQFDFGKTKLSQMAWGAEPGTQLIDPRNAPRSAIYNAARSVQVASNQAGGLLNGGAKKAIFRTELDAYAFEQFTPGILNAAKGDLQNRRGLGGFVQGIKEKVAGRSEQIGGALGQLNGDSKAIADIPAQGNKAIGTIEQLTKSFFKLAAEQAKMMPGGGMLSTLLEDAGKLSQLAKPLLIAFVGFQVLKQVAGWFGELAKATSQSALEFSRFEQILSFTSSANKAAATIANLRDESKKLGIDLKQSIAGQSSLQAATRGGKLEGSATERLGESMRQASAV